MRTPLVRHGVDEKRRPDRKTGRSTHRFHAVYSEMFLQISQDYASLPDPRSLTRREIRFYYDGVREGLKKHSAPKG